MTDTATHWKRKLAAFLHDPPSKCLNLRDHEEWSASAMAAAGLEPGHYPRQPDWDASAADRLPFPKSRPASISCAFDGVKAGFHHPLGGNNEHAAPSILHFDAELPGLDVLEGQDSQVQPVLDDEPIAAWSEADKARARFFAHWRLWRQWATEKDWRFQFLPADTRLPDHTVWHHMQVTSALAGCIPGDSYTGKPAPSFLKFQLGPVQEFIAAARSTRDLWSGSYLLSWLMAAGLKALSREVGPDAVLFPSLWSQPLFDLHWRDGLWAQISLSNRPSAKKCWDAIKPSESSLLTPNLPNVVLALVPAERAGELAKCVESAIRGEWKRIADSVWNTCASHGLTAGDSAISAQLRRHRFEEQVDRFLSLSWATTPWPEDLESSLALAQGFPADHPLAKALARVEVVKTMAETLLPGDHRDSRCYHNAGRPDYTIADPARLNSRGLAWPILVARNAWELDAVRNVREFHGQWSGEPGVENNKDSLSGKDEAVAGGKEWSETARRVANDNIPWKSLFKQDDWLGAVTLVKRLWHLSYLRDKWGLPTGLDNGRRPQMPMPNVHGIASGKPFSNDDAKEPDADESYFAVLAFDGDEIGKWVSGEKTPRIRKQLADYTDGTNAQRKGILEYFERASNPDAHKNGTLAERMGDFLDSQRAISPSYHLQFSEALGNFALHCAASIVEAHNGRLVYCGGDDVLALLPAHSALECARDLNRAFQGEAPAKSVTPSLRGGNGKDKSVIDSKWPGFLTSKGLRESTGRATRDEEREIPFIVPGPAATASVGIAIAHFKSPLQDVVRAAQVAEKRAKTKLGRAAVALSVMKRSGEITEWGCQWASGGLELYAAIAQGLESGSLSSKFPHRVCQLLEPYLTARTGLQQSGTSTDIEALGAQDAKDLILREVAFAIERQSKPGRARENAESLKPVLAGYLGNLAAAHDKAVEKARRENLNPPSLPQTLFQAIIGLCTVVAFAHRTKPES